MSVYILPYKHLSRAAFDLSRGLHARRIALLRNTYTPTPVDVVINWGNTSERAEMIGKRCKAMLNNPAKVRAAVNKISFLELCKEHKLPSPKWTTSITEAQKWGKEHEIVARTLVEASGGRGIALVPVGGALPPAKLYTIYSPKRAEFRIHVMQGQIIDEQQKKLKEGTENPNTKIRSHANGWIFARQDIKVPEVVKTAAINAINALGLDFGAVDIGYQEAKDRAVIYEVNTAPGLEGTTLENYITKIKEVLKTYGSKVQNSPGTATDGTDSRKRTGIKRVVRRTVRV